MAFRLGMIVCREDRVLVLDERYQVPVVVAPDDEDALAAVPFRGWDAPGWQSSGGAQCVLSRNTVASSPVCPTVRPNSVRDGSIGSQRQPRSQ